MFLDVYIPCVLFSTVYAPSCRAMFLDVYIPCVLFNTVYAPSCRAMFLDVYIPSVLFNTVYAPPCRAMFLDVYIPSVLFNTVYAPPCRAMFLDVYIPSVLFNTAYAPPCWGMSLDIDIPSCRCFSMSVYQQSGHVLSGLYFKCLVQPCLCPSVSWHVLSGLYSKLSMFHNAYAQRVGHVYFPQCLSFIMSTSHCIGPCSSMSIFQVVYVQPCRSLSVSGHVLRCMYSTEVLFHCV